MNHALTLAVSLSLALGIGSFLTAEDDGMGGGGSCCKENSKAGGVRHSLPSQAAFLAGYFDGVKALSEDDDTAAATAFKKLEASLKTATGIKNPSAFQKAVSALTAAKGIKEIRSKLDAVSRLVEKYGTESGLDKQGVSYFYCPMAKGNWASLQTGVQNPYYGQAMLGCGKKVSAPQ